MDDKFFAGLHEGLLVHCLYLMSGTEVLDTSPASWKVTCHIFDESESIILTSGHPFPEMVNRCYLEEFTGPHFLLPSYGCGKPLLLGIEFVIDYPEINK